MMPASSAAPFLDTSPPIWAVRALASVLLAIFAAGMLALLLVRVPETVTAPFVLVPEQGADPVRTLHDGIVRTVRVTDAQAVEPDTILFTIGSELVGDRTAERTALGTSLSGGQNRLANERQKYRNQRKADEQELDRLQQRLAALASRAQLKDRQVQIAREIASRQQKSLEEGLTSWIEASRPRLEAERLAVDLDETRAESMETQAAMPRLRFEMASRKAAFDEIVRSVQEELDRAGARKGMLDGEPSREGNMLTVRAPCAGTIVRLVVKNAGSVVHASDVLAEIACREDRLQAELQVPQRGLALLRAGQPVKLRYDAFPYQRYGVRYGTLRWLSPTSSAPSAGGWFRALANLDEQMLHISGEPRAVLPGMGGSASIVVGRRTLASYALEPLRRVRRVRAARVGDAAPDARPGAVGHTPSAADADENQGISPRPAVPHQRHHRRRASAACPAQRSARARRQRDRARESGPGEGHHRSPSDGGGAHIEVRLARQPARALQRDPGGSGTHHRPGHS